VSTTSPPSVPPALPSGSPSVPVPAVGGSPVGGVFGPASEWKRDVSAAPLAVNSAEMVQGLVKQVATHYGTAAFNANQYSTTFFVAKPGTPRKDVKFNDCQGKGYVPSQLHDPAQGAHFKDVPIPDEAVPAAGTDSELTVWDPATDQLWEFWVAKKRTDGWYACWGGRIDRVSTSPGFFPNRMGATATSLPNAGGMVGLAEARAGRIDHALSLQLVDLEHFTVVSYPAQRSDGWNPEKVPRRIPEGTRLRLDPGVDVDALNLHPLAKLIAKAAQKYGFIVTDRSGAVAVLGESGAPEQARTGTDPWQALLKGTPGYAMMRNFPWHKLQALPHNHGKP
jgi:hypothetical protein